VRNPSEKEDLMDMAAWAETLMKMGEERITRAVDRILSTTYLQRDRGNACVQEAIESLETTTRDEIDALKEQLGTLQTKVNELNARLGALAPAGRKKKATFVR
jgi:polyhydroxyalkanoate synthesis regulator phasin